MAASTTEMLMNADGLVVNAYHNAEGRGNYFPGSSGTSEGQFLFIIGNLHAYQATGNPIAKEMAERALRSLLKVIYRNMPVPDVVTQTAIFAPHWLFNVKYPFDSSIIHYDRMANFTNGVGYLTVNPDKVRYVYGARSTNSKLLWDNPYSPLTQGTAYAVAGSEYVPGVGMKVTLASAFTGTLYVTHSTQTGPAIQVNEPFEAWPDWRKLDPGEIACAADVFVWAHRAFTLASQVLPNPTWAAAARATREQAAIAFDINDSRDWIKPSWAKSAFAIGSRFQFTSRVPAPAYSVNSSGDVVISVPTYGSGSPQVQYGNASVQDVYGANDVTQVEIGASQKMTVSVFIDPAQQYVDEEHRYFASLSLSGNGVKRFNLKRSDFLSGGTWGGAGSTASGGVTITGVGNFRYAGTPEDYNSIGVGTARNSAGHMVMARLLMWRGGYNAQQFDVAVFNGNRIGDRSDTSGVATWLSQWTDVSLLRADGSVLVSLPLAQLATTAVSNGQVRSQLFENSVALNSQLAEYLANYALVKFVRFSNASDNETIRTYGRPLPANSPVYTFGVITDDQAAHSVTLRRVRQTPPRDVMYYPGAIPFTANFQGNPAQLIDWRGPIYMGYQSPAMWAVIGQPGPAATDIQLLSDAQQQWRVQTGQATLGPFAPVFIFDRPDAVQYGPPNSFTWEGPDPNTRWGGYQYRPLPELVEAASLLSGAAKTEAIRVAQNFIKWLAQDWAWLPSWAPWVNTFAHTLEHVAAVQIPTFSRANLEQWTQLINKTAAVAVQPQDTERPVLDVEDRYTRPLYSSPTVFPDRPPLGPPTDFPKGKAEINYPEPHMAALIMRSVIQLDQIQRPNGDASGPMQIEHRAVISKCMALLDALWIEDGVMGGTFSQNPGGHEWYGFWHGEILDTLALAFTWGRSANVNRTSISNQAKIWIDGMLRWSKAAVLPETSGYQVVPWRYTPNWKSSVTETFEFSTDIFEAFSGKEQRISKRTTPRRRLGMRHLLTNNEARGFDALLRARQNLPLLVPQWQLGIRVTEEAPAGQTYLIVAGADLSVFQWNMPAMLSRDNGPAVTITVASTSTGRIDLAAPLAAAVLVGDKALPAANGLIDQDLSATRHTGTVLEAQVGFIMLPQQDPYSLPQVASLSANRFPIGSDNREIIQLRPNWVTEPKVNQAWSFETSESFPSGPIVPINGRDQGSRTVQALWTLKNKAEIDSFKGLLWRLRGRRYAAWLPSWTDDFVLTRDVTSSNTIFVKSSPYIDLGTVFDPAVALHLHLRDGRNTAARVTAVTEINSDEFRLTLDRAIITGELRAFQMVSLMYRVRQVSDSTTITYRTDTVAEVTASFVSVYDEVQ